jgi:5-methylcytosine-specific restriction enzyme subunit McrC
MNKPITVREYAKLTPDAGESTLDCAQVSEAAFDWLCRLQERFRKSGATVGHLEGRRSLRLDQYVGVVQAPDGTTIEILPKHVGDEDDVVKLRQLLARMIRQALDVPPRTTEPAALTLFNYPLSEWIIQQLVQTVDRLVQRGVRFEYQRVEEEHRFIRGQLDLVRLLRQSPGRAHRVHIRHDLFTADRPENRLIKSALGIARKLTRHPANWRLANELLHYFDPVPESESYTGDFSRWRDDKLMMHYRFVRPWCELLLNRMNPTAQVGKWQGISLLFPMDRLYERYVAASLWRRLEVGAVLTAQACSESLCHHFDAPWFALKPDMLIRQGERGWILDTKWKRLDEAKSTTEHKYDLSQDDFYQLFAYGHKYLDGKGDTMLVFPKTRNFRKPLPPFLFSDDLRLWVVPFDLELAALVEGDWVAAAPWYLTQSKALTQDMQKLAA